MTRSPRSMTFLSLTLAAALCSAGCHHDQTQTAQSQPTQNPSTDPADANLAPTSADAGNQAAAPVESEQQPSDNSESASASPPDAGYDDYSESAVESAPQPPPELPSYQQPPCPGDNYIWTPGYWSYASSGYYWVPGAWVEPPYQGALWTPGYWGSNAGRYSFFPGHWGTHIGYYGGINYGFGYTGLGYQGGYWNHDHFEYNRSVNNVDSQRVHYAYNYPVAQDNRTAHISFNGGQRGVQVRPRPQEVQAWHEPVAPRMTSQVQHAQTYRTDRNQFALVNHGRPMAPVVAKPIQADRNVHPERPQPAPRQHASEPSRDQIHGGPAQRENPARPREPNNQERNNKDRKPDNEKRPNDRP